jgi:hypothetical protein
MARVWFLACCLVLAEQKDLERLGRFEDRALREVSGIAQSRRHPGVFWVHNDSGNAPELFAVKRNGALVAGFRVAVPNIDWEDIATDDAGHLYIGEIGNNGGALPLRAIYRVDEPDPFHPTKEPLRVTLSTFYTFPDKKSRFDAEGLFLLDGKAIVVAKTFDERDAELYAVPLDPPAPFLKPSVPERVGALPGFVKPATGASLSADGRRLAVCSSQGEARVYERAPKNTWRGIGEKVQFKEGGVEAICWDGNDLILASEHGGIFRISDAEWKSTGERPLEKPQTVRP